VGGSASAGPFALQAAYEKGPCQLATAGAEALPLSSRPSNLLSYGARIFLPEDYS
jgi:hypothetical protein